MSMHWRSFLVISVFLSFVTGGLSCTDNHGEFVRQESQECDPTAPPIVFAHGFLEVGDAFANQSMRFASNGYCADRIYAFDYNTLQGFSRELERFGIFVDHVLAETGASQIDLVGHSMGTGLSVSYLSDPDNAAKVAHYANLAGIGGIELPAGVPTVTISSKDDYIAGESQISGAKNVSIPGLDHLQVATSAETFSELYSFFNGGVGPQTTEMVPTKEVTLLGRVITFAENQPAPDLELRIYPVDPQTGGRLKEGPVATFLSNDNGDWGPFHADPGQHYEYEILSTDQSSRPLHYYREPIPRSCNLVYFRVFPPPSSLAGLILGFLPYGDDHALLATLNLSQAVIAGRDTLLVDEYEISREDVTPAEKTAIAIFYFDANANSVSDGQAAGGFFNAFTFIQAFDLLIETAPQRTVPLEFNGRVMSVRNWKSDTEGVTIAVFE